jgi:hypothetical protein
MDVHPIKNVAIGIAPFPTFSSQFFLPVPVARFYHPVIDVPNWRPARLIGELRAEKGVRRGASNLGVPWSTQMFQDVPQIWSCLV